jgi:histidinol-phosphate aminotransferase
MSQADIRGLIRPDLLNFEPYIPIEPPDVLSEASGLAPERIVKLDANENPYGCSPRVAQALGQHQAYQFYPDPSHQEVRELLQDYVGVEARHLFICHGSSELIDLLLRLTIAPGDQVIDCVPTFIMYSLTAQICGARVIEIPRDGEYHIDRERVLAAVKGGAKLIFLSSPNNPTGNAVPKEFILELLDTGILVVVDEAYYEFSGMTVAQEVPKHQNLVVLRTFSKWAGLAGLRVGYGILPDSLATYLWRIKPPYNVNVAAQIAVRESLADLPYLQGTVQKIVAERECMLERLKGLDFLRPFPSHANFIFCHVLRASALDIRNELRRAGIFVRYFDKPLTRNSLRITVGRPEDTDRLMAALEEIGRRI